MISFGRGKKKSYVVIVLDQKMIIYGTSVWVLFLRKTAFPPVLPSSQHANSQDDDHWNYGHGRGGNVPITMISYGGILYYCRRVMREFYWNRNVPHIILLYTLGTNKKTGKLTGSNFDWLPCTPSLIFAKVTDSSCILPLLGISRLLPIA